MKLISKRSRDRFISPLPLCALSSVFHSQIALFAFIETDEVDLKLQQGKHVPSVPAVLQSTSLPASILRWDGDGIWSSTSSSRSHGANASPRSSRWSSSSRRSRRLWSSTPWGPWRSRSSRWGRSSRPLLNLITFPSSIASIAAGTTFQARREAIGTLPL